MTFLSWPTCLPALALMASSSALAQDAASPVRHELWLDTGFATYHVEKDRNLNGKNAGIGFEYKFSNTMALTAGRFYNSDRAHSRYAGLMVQPWTLGGIKLGAVVGAFDGYPKMREGRPFVALIPAATFEYKRVGINVAAVPKFKDRLHAGMSVQLKFKLWE